jgi:rhodanese-related sulfurtransferase
MNSTLDPNDLAALRHLQPLVGMSPDRLHALAPMCQRDSFPRGSNPLLERDWRGRVVYLAKGELKVDASSGGAEVLVGGSGRALWPLRRDGREPRATKAITDVQLLSLDEDPLDVLVTWDQLAAVPLSGQAQAQATNWSQMSGMFAVHNLTQGAFASLPPANIPPLLQRFVRMEVKRGNTIIRQGDDGDYFYLIERGRCKVNRLVAGVPVELAELTEGDAFGEEALVADAQRNATVTMKTDGVLLRLAKSDFVTLLREPLLQRLSPTEALKRAAAGATWIDVRFPAEFQQDGLPQAKNIPLNDIRLASQALDPGRDYIVYCQTGRRSSAAAFLLSQRGIRASLLDGGLKALTAVNSEICA